MEISAWQYSTVHNSACKVIEEQTLWGQTVCRVWLPNQDAVVRVPRSTLRPLSADLQPEIEAGRIAYVAAAAKVAEVLEGSTSATDGHVLLAPMESNVIPLPHQIQVEMVMRHKSRIGFFVGAWVGMSVMPFTYPVDNLPQVEIVFAPPWVSVGEVFQVVVQGTPAADGRELLYEWGAKLGDQTEVEVFQAGSMAKIVAPELPSRVLEDVITVEVIVLENSLASAPAMVGIPLYHARLAFPQVGVGSIDEHQRLETSIVLVNSLDEYAFGTFRFTAGQEDPGEWEVLVDGVPASKFEFMMEPFSSREFLVTGDDVRAGWLDLTANISLAGHLFYRVRSTTGAGDEGDLERREGSRSFQRVSRRGALRGSDRRRAGCSVP